MMEKIREALTKDYSQQALKAYNIIKEKHTFKHRIEEMLRVIDEI